MSTTNSEVWLPIKGFELLYSVSNTGNVHSHRANRNLALIKDASGYQIVTLSKGGKSKNHLVHRLVVEAFIGTIDKKMRVDHIDRNPLNNHVDNLRICTIQQNTWNSRTKNTNTSGYKGVYATPSKKRWYASIYHYGKQIRLGTFDTKEEAALAYNIGVQERCGEFAWLNSVNENT